MARQSQIKIAASLAGDEMGISISRIPGLPRALLAIKEGRRKTGCDRASLAVAHADAVY